MLTQVGNDETNADNICILYSHNGGWGCPDDSISDPRQEGLSAVMGTAAVAY